MQRLSCRSITQDTGVEHCDVLQVVQRPSAYDNNEWVRPGVGNIVLNNSSANGQGTRDMALAD